MLTAITRDVLLENVRRWRGGAGSSMDEAGALAAVIRAVRKVRNGVEGVPGVPFQWQWWRTPYDFRTLGARRITISTAITDNSTGTTAVVSSDPTNLTVDGLAGRFLEFEESEPGVFREVKSNTATTLTLHNAYAGPGVASGETALVHKLAYDLPDNFDYMLSVRPKGSRAGYLAQADSPAELLENSDAAPQAPTRFAIGYYSRDDAAAATRQARLFLHPPPTGPAVNSSLDDDDESCQYACEYWRKPGWRDASTGLWKLAPTAASDTVDFYPDRIELLEAAIKVCLCEELPDLQIGGYGADYWEGRFATHLAPAMRGDANSAKTFKAGRYGQGASSAEWPPSFSNYPRGTVITD